MLEKGAKVLCQKCGFPDCTCQACTQSMGKGRARERHQCWLHLYGAHPKTVNQDPIHNQRVPQFWVEARKQAWANIGMDLELHWDGSSKSYYLAVPTVAMERQRKRQKILEEGAGAEAEVLRERERDLVKKHNLFRISILL